MWKTGKKKANQITLKKEKQGNGVQNEREKKKGKRLREGQTSNTNQGKEGKEKVVKPTQKKRGHKNSKGT